MGASYNLIVSNRFTLTPRLDVSHQSSPSGSLIVDPATRLAARPLVNGELRADMNKWYAEAWVTKMFDQRYVAGIQDLGAIWYPGALRQNGLRVGFNF